MKHAIVYSAGLISVLMLSGSISVGQTAKPAEDLTQTVKYLLDFVVNSSCSFIRNGQSYTPNEAAEHMKAKYDYFKKQIKTAEDFIRLAATKSLISGQPYLVKTKDGKEIESAVWLSKVLNDYRTSH